MQRGYRSRSSLILFVLINIAWAGLVALWVYYSINNYQTIQRISMRLPRTLRGGTALVALAGAGSDAVAAPGRDLHHLRNSMNLVHQNLECDPRTQIPSGFSPTLPGNPVFRGFGGGAPEGVPGTERCGRENGGALPPYRTILWAPSPAIQDRLRLRLGSATRLQEYTWRRSRRSTGGGKKGLVLELDPGICPASVATGRT